MRFLVPVALALVAGFVPARAETPSELKKLCDFICGYWRSDQLAPEIAHVVYELDEPSGLIWGRERKTGGDGEQSGDVTTVFGWDTDKTTLWMMQSGGGDLPNLGAVTLTERGFAYSLTRFAATKEQGGTGGEYRFDGPDSYMDFFWVNSDDFNADGGSGPYRRVAGPPPADMR